MGVDEDDVCGGLDKWHATEVVTFSLTLLVSFPTQVCFCVWFIHRFLNTPELSWKHPLMSPILGYLITSTSATSLAFFNNVVQPMIQTGMPPSLKICAATVSVSWWMNGITYVALMECWLSRLVAAMSGSAVKVRRRTQWMIRSTIFLATLIGTGLAIWRAFETQCWAIRKTGIIGKSTLYPRRTFYYCTVPKRWQWISQSQSALTVIVTVIINSMLLIMFIQRLRYVSRRQTSTVSHSSFHHHSNHHHNRRDVTGYSEIIERTLVCCMLGMVSTLLSFTLLTFTGVYALIFVDHLVNTLAMYLLFSFADGWYHWLFDRPLSWMKRVCSPSVIRPRLQMSINSNTMSRPSTKSSRDNHTVDLSMDVDRAQ